MTRSANSKTYHARQRKRVMRVSQSIYNRHKLISQKKCNINQYLEERNENHRAKNESNFDLIGKLSEWVSEYNIPARAVTALLRILILSGMHWLPKDSRTLMQTPRFVEIKDIAGGKYWYNGLTYEILRIFTKISTDMVLQLNINVDGLPIYKSSSTTFWPILCNFHGEDKSTSIQLIYDLKFMNTHVENTHNCS